MAIPAVDIEVLDGALGLTEGSPAQASLTIGITSKGDENTLYGFTDITTLVEDMGKGPGVEACALKILTAGGTHYIMCPTRSVYGSVGATTHTGTGTSTCVGNEAPGETITVVCVTPGALGTATFTFALGDGEASAPVTSAAGWAAEYQVVGTLTKLAFTAGTGYDATDAFTITPLGVITQTVNAGALTGVIATQTSSPLVGLDILVVIVDAGALGAATFRYSLDGGNTYFPSERGSITVPGGGKYALADNGVFLTFAGTFVADDTYAMVATEPGYGTSDATTAAAAADADATEWGFIHFVGAPSSAANAATLASTVDTAMELMATGFRYAFAFVECPTTESDATVKAALDSFVSVRVSVGAGDMTITSPIAGTGDQIRNAAWSAAARAAQVGISEDLARVRRGPLRSVRSLERDERATPALDVGRFTTARTFAGKKGMYLTNGRLMAEVGSDFQYVQHRRVMDEGCRVGYAGLLEWLNEGVRVDATTGFIDERDALAIEAEIGTKVRDALKGHASAIEIHVARDENIISTETLTVDIRLIPKAYAKQIRARIGFKNPALTPVTA